MPTSPGLTTFLFTDIESSTRLWDEHPKEAGLALARHDQLLEELVQKHGGNLVRPRGEGDSRFAVFRHAPSAVAAACAIQCAFVTEWWPTPEPVRVRMALHTGSADLRNGDYYGSDVNRCARLRAVAHAGQILLSQRTAESVRDVLPNRVTLQGLGQHRLKDLAVPERIYQLRHPSLPAEFPPLKSLSSLLNNLPVQSTSFVGREPDLIAVQRLLKTTRLLTLTGTGGSGKTRLALHAAANVLDDFDDGVWLVELGPLGNGAHVTQAVASVLDIREDMVRPLLKSLLETLRPKQALLILDNCEHLIAACATLADQLLRGCPHLRLLATSREALGISGETAWRVPALSLPEDNRMRTLDAVHQSGAGSLFLDRAAAAQPDLVLNEQDVPAIVEICRRLDGIPLALELAAARVRVLSVEQIAARLDRRFHLLTGGNRAALPRQQTLAATVDWSYELLRPEERTLFERLSVFAGGWTLDAAETVGAGAGIRAEFVLHLLTELVNKSLVVVEQSLVIAEARGTRIRYRLPETMRDYALAQLQENGHEPPIRLRHADYFLAQAERVAKVRDPGEGDRRNELEADYENFRSALRWCIEVRDVDRALRLGAALWRFWRTRGYLSEGRQRLLEVRKLADDAPATPARTLGKGALSVGLGALAAWQGDFAYARSMLEDALDIFRRSGDQANTALALAQLGNVLLQRHENPALARALHEECLSIRRQLGDQWEIASSLNDLGVVSFEEGDYERAQVLHEESLAMKRQLGDQWMIAVSLLNLGAVAQRRSDTASARALLGESLAIFRQLRDSRMAAQSLAQLGNVTMIEGDTKFAQARLEESLGLTREVGDQHGTAAVLNLLGVLALHGQDYSGARRVLEECVAICRQSGDRHTLERALRNLADLPLAGSR
jgi:predicted ATPase/class 3 adenylate cyclase